MILIRTTQAVSLQRDNYNIKMCLNSSEISIIFSSANTVSSMNLILSIPRYQDVSYMKGDEWCDNGGFIHFSVSYQCCIWILIVYLYYFYGYIRYNSTTTVD